MKIFSAKQVYEADRSTIERQQISSDALMERASLQLFNWVHHRLKGAPVTVRLFCGVGNNGGDGLALARHLNENGYKIAVYVVKYSDKRSEDFLGNLDRLKSHKIWPDFLGEDSAFPEVDAGDILIDALFGIGLNRPPDKWVGQIITKLNASGAFTISVDVPSGLYVDKHTPHNAVVFADVVLTFQSPKLVFFLPQPATYADNWVALDIGLDSGYLEETETEYVYIEKSSVLEFYKPRATFSHKGNYGHALIIGGSYGKIGAVQLSALACLKSGAGLVTSLTPRCGYLPMQTALPEVMVLTDTGENHLTSFKTELSPTVVGIGVGMGIHDKTTAAFADFLDGYSGPLVVDADGLNILARNKQLLDKLPPGAILTPHPGELERLIGRWKNDFDKLKKGHDFCRKHRCVLLIKGAYTIALFKGKGYVNSTGNPGMATAGSGDTLTGIITGLLSQGYEPLSAALLGAYIHGRAGDMGASAMGYEALTAGSIIEFLGLAFLELTAGDGRLPEEQADH
jgi:hydroxyethylthiazole kinase-like uncharacterized protein yjeF